MFSQAPAATVNKADSATRYRRLVVPNNYILRLKDCVPEAIAAGASSWTGTGYSVARIIQHNSLRVTPSSDDLRHCFILEKLTVGGGTYYKEIAPVDTHFYSLVEEYYQ